MLAMVRREACGGVVMMSVDMTGASHQPAHFNLYIHSASIIRFMGVHVMGAKDDSCPGLLCHFYQEYSVERRS